MMDILRSLAAARLIFILGIVNLVTAFFVLFTCRCLPTSRIGGRLMKYRPYQRFYKFHCYVWAVFWPSVVIHAFLALTIYGWPG